MADANSRATSTNADIATQDQPKEPEVDQRQQGDNKGGSNPETQPQHDEPPPPSADS